MITHLFRRDLNIFDNFSLYSLLKKYSYKQIKYLFIFNKQQIEDNELFNEYQFNFMCSQLSYLSSFIDLSFYYVSKVEEEINIIKKLKVTTLSFNKDYTPYAKYRDRLLEDYCNENNIELITSDFYYWTRPYEHVYLKFSSFYDHYNKNKIHINYTDIKKYNPSNNIAYKIKPINHRIDAISIMKNKFNDYEKHDIFTYKSTELGVYLKFCIVTSREVYNNYINNKPLARQIIFRDFFYVIDYKNPQYFKNKETIKNIKWKDNQDNINRFLNGTTGENIVDAAISQLKKTNYVHNRARMICVNYLVKHLEENWLHGELLFAKYLKDYDPIINFQNWVHMSGLHIYSFQYYRVFSYERQIKLYNGIEYINTYLNEKDKNVSKIKYDSKATEYMKKMKNLNKKI